MRRIAVICAMGVLLAGCGGHSPAHEAKASSDQATACSQADNAVRDQFAKLSQSRDSGSGEIPSEARDAMIKMIDTCGPVVSGLRTDSPDPQIAQGASICKLALELKIKGYQQFVDGVATAATEDILAEGIDKGNECTRASAKLQGGSS